jgi:hypothetical protein
MPSSLPMVPIFQCSAQNRAANFDVGFWADHGSGSSEASGKRGKGSTQRLLLPQMIMQCGKRLRRSPNQRRVSVLAGWGFAVFSAISNPDGAGEGIEREA